MKILIADLFSEDCISKLKDEGFEVIYDLSLAGETLCEVLGSEQPEVLVVRSTKVTKDVIDAGTKLELVIRAGSGVDNIDTSHCSSKRIYVANCPGKNSVAVAELTMALILSVDRRIAENVNLLKQDTWNKGEFCLAQGLKGKVLGIAGFGNIGKLVAKRAHAFDMHILAYDIYLDQSTARENEATKVDTLDELLAKSDIVSLHMPKTKETLGMVNKDFLAKMKPTAHLINTSRGDLINEEDLLAKLEETKTFWYAADVFLNEPTGSKKCEFKSDLAKHPRVYGTHHIGASTKQAEKAIGEETVKIIKKYGKLKLVSTYNCVNIDSKKVNNHVIAIWHKNKVGIFAQVFPLLAGAGWNLQEICNTVFEGRESCCAQVTFEGDISGKEGVIKSISEIEDIYKVSFVIAKKNK